jgi:hypothetical protein
MVAIVPRNDLARCIEKLFRAKEVSIPPAACSGSYKIVSSSRKRMTAEVRLRLVSRAVMTML